MNDQFDPEGGMIDLNDDFADGGSEDSFLRKRRLDRVG